MFGDNLQNIQKKLCPNFYLENLVTLHIGEAATEVT